MTFQAEPIVEKSDDELDPLVLVLLPITILVGILALISVISEFMATIAITYHLLSLSSQSQSPTVYTRQSAGQSQRISS